MLESRKVILIGPMGAGKSTIGKLLAQETGWPYIDNDVEMAALSGLNTEQLSQLPVFELHQLESQCLKEISKKPAPFVAGAAASVVDYPENIDILRSLTSIYLRLPLEHIVERAGQEGVGRGNIHDDLEKVLRKRFMRRDPICRDVAKYTIDLGANPHSDSKRILTFLGK